MTTHYHAGWNMVGYLPEMDASYPFESFEAAQESLREDMRLAADSVESWADEHDCADVPCEVYGDECPYDAGWQIRMAGNELIADSGPEWGAIVGNVSYWIVECVEEECLEEEEYAR